MKVFKEFRIDLDATENQVKNMSQIELKLIALLLIEENRALRKLANCPDGIQIHLTEGEKPPTWPL
jgi:hypothetical protein